MRPLFSKLCTNSLSMKKSRKFLIRSLVMYIPPKEPVVRAMLPVTDPNILQNKWSVSLDKWSGFGFIAAAVISEGE